MDLRKLILEQRQIKENSLKSYLISLKKLNHNEEIENLDFLNDKKHIIEKIELLALPTQKNYLTAVLVALQAEGGKEKLVDFYKETLDKKNEKYSNFIKQNKKTEKQEKNWVTMKDLNAIRKQYEKKIKEFEIKDKETLNNKNFNMLQEYLISALYTLRPPVRLDYAPMKIIKKRKEIEPEKNYLLNTGRNKKKFIIQEFKTKKKYGTQEIDIPPKLNTIINLWLKHNKTDSFLLNSRKGNLTANGLGKLITKTFKDTGKNITLNLLRHIFISENVDLEAVKHNKKLAEEMLHSEAMQEDYAKN
tara:strand:+ start:1084 stop:1995 length:912 start_codon:yes stop_codon:yes gene_type:complete